MSGRAYNNLRKLIEDLDGTMVYQRKGYRYGAWIIKIGSKRAVVEATGERSLPAIDSLHIPKRSNPKYWDDYSATLMPDARERLMRLLG